MKWKVFSNQVKILVPCVLVSTKTILIVELGWFWVAVIGSSALIKTRLGGAIG